MSRATYTPATRTPPRAPRLRFGRTPVRSPLGRAVVRHAMLLTVIAIMLYPLFWMVGASFRPNNEVFTTLGIWPSNFTLDNYTEGWTSGQFSFSRYFLNSLVITGLSVVGNVVACMLAAYAFARLDFPFKRVLFAIMLGTLLLPYHVTLVPQYIMFSELQWINTILPLVIPKFLATDAFFIFLMVQFIRVLPREMDDAARIDGCGYWGIFRRIIVPLSLPAMGTVAMFTFIFTWNDFLGPLLYLSRPDMWTVAQGLNNFVDATGQSAFGPLLAMATLSIAPIVGFFLVTQRLLVEGIATSGLK
ncbi:carbohydrate ABC transporter permease [Phytoactinopolyspora halotolerans]|uniref:Carbohydrate ABC transporter permease n=1 Tax=Phytoactinopolyspora halotolerans TaxID=1981512 RepID=A0A6L9S0V6_9ACTN|nr:carbohydrate ABC transporter permease [Phytoactinopolyspora halotolerans]NED98568.1 carbohydrate ABC transporter permease [Phytoactinopolyspora halotolerans]